MQIVIDIDEEDYKIMQHVIANGRPLSKRIELKPCEDAVSRKDLYNALYEHFHDEDAPNNITDVRLGAVRNFVKDFPSVTPARPKGKWVDIHVKEEWYGDQYKCSLCGAVTIDNGLYCPHCGADMRE